MPAVFHTRPASVGARRASSLGLKGLLVGLAFAAVAPLASAQANGFYRFPALRGQQVWFTAEGDLWRTDIAGGTAQRVTTHPGSESRAELSPDGRSVAFVGAYEGPSEAYVMPVGGGVPKRLTWDGQGVLVWGWTPAGEVLVAAPSLNGQPERQLYAIDPKTLARRALPVAQASDGAVSADGQTLYFTRSGLRGDNARGYRGGALARLWAIDLGGQTEARPLVDRPANLRRPMPYVTAQGQARVAFLSDEDGSINLWSVDAQGGDLRQHTRQHTRHQGWDIRHAGIDGTRVVYALGADLRLADLAAGTDVLLPISLGGDFDQQRTRWIKRAQPYLTNAALAPNGERVALTLRGHVATQGVGPLRRAELPIPPDGRCRGAVFSHDNRFIYALCDLSPSSEVEAWRFNANDASTGSHSAPVQITRGADTQRVALFPSPDGQWLAHVDKNGRTYLTALTANGAGDTRVIDTSRYRVSEPSVTWSPDSRALVLVRPEGHAIRDQLLLYTLADQKLLPLTSDRYDSASPAFTPDGKWLYFLSDRSFTSSSRSPWGDRNLGPYFDRRGRVYALALQPGLRFPYQARDELEMAAAATPASPASAASAASAPGSAPPSAAATPPAATPASAAASKPAAAAPKLPAIVTAGLTSRLFEVPMPAGNFTKLRTDGKRLYVLEADSTAERRTSLRTLAIENTEPKPELFAGDVRDFDLTPDGKKLMVAKYGEGDGLGEILLVDAAPKLPADTAKQQVRWTDWPLSIEPQAEWRQMFADAWRMHRDHFYDAGMHGVDWAAMRRKYEPLLPRVTDRAELNELLAQMVSELGALHSQVYTRDLREGPDPIPAAGLGARFSKVANGFRVEQLYLGDPELPADAGPLLPAGVQRGDVITQINGRPTPDLADLSEALRGQAGRQVLIGLRSTDGKERQAVMLPVTAEREAQLRTGDWERRRAERVATQSNGRIGYLRLRAMGPADIANFAREFYAQIERDGLIIDVRGNNGGSIDSWVIEKLLRRTWAWWQPRSPAGSPPFGNMQQTFRGQLAVLIDENTYSDGETFAEGVQRLKLAPLIGKRTSGAGVWLSDGNRLLDNGLARAAETGQFSPEGTWLIEGKGVAPDIEVDNLPRATFNGGDAQLDAAIANLQKRLAEQPVPQVTAPKAYPRPYAKP